jgi:hypothetical protein
MIKWNGESRIWRQYVKEARLTQSWPGYSYVYFTGAKDAEEFFSKTLEEGWESQNWVKFLLRRRLEHDERVENRRGMLSFDAGMLHGGCITNYYTQDPNNYEYIAKYYITKHGITNIDALANNVKAKGYKPDYNKLRTYIGKYHKTARQENPDRRIIVELIKYYHNQKFSLRKIAAALEKDGISMQFRQIGNIIKDLNNE